MRPLWKGAVTFGLVYVPVKVFAATERKDLKLNLLHEACRTPVQYRKWCPVCGREVPPEEIVRAYQYEKGRYVLLGEELEGLDDDTGHSITILDFVELSQIDPVYYDKAYYLAPVAGGEKVYDLLKKAMQKTKKVAVAKVILRRKVSLAALRAAENVLLMSTMFYADEVRNPVQLAGLDYHAKLHENEVKMAISLIESLSTDFRPEKYADEHREALFEIIQSRVANEMIVEPAARPAPENVVDLMQALKASIEKAAKERQNPPSPGKRTVRKS
jgi:DNA end-binding protein Ku